MIEEIRKQYNREFTEEKYAAFQKELNSYTYYPADFRVCETPLFLSDSMRDKLIEAGEEITAQLRTDAFKKQCAGAIPKGLEVPNEDAHTTFLQIDYAICKDENGDFFPQLIELQGFPSLYAFQYYLPRIIRNHFSIPEGFTPYFSGMNDEKYAEMLSKVIVGESDPENVILLEIDPASQKTRIDFASTEDLIKVKSVCITKIRKRGNKLFYTENGREIPVDRIYNRVIYDELKRKEIKYDFRFTDELDVKWVGHPNWFFKISKYTLPFLKSRYVPKSFMLNELTEYPADLENYVLKPLFSFAGLGVKIDIDKKSLDEITDRENYILQHKIEYTPLIETPDEKSRVEIRMMYLWDEEPVLVNNLVRTSKGKMMGVDFNKNKVWVGSSCAFHR